MTKEQNNLAQNLKALRAAAGKTLLDVENETGIGNKIIHKYETGACSPNVDKVFLLAAYYRISVGVLLTSEIELKYNIKTTP